MPLSFDTVTFTHPGAPAPLLADLSAHFPPTWTGIVGPNGAGKSTVLHLAAGDLEPQRGSIRRPGHIVFCPQRTDHPPPLLEPFLTATDATAPMLRGLLAVEVDWADRWPTLSHGERKRAQIGVALWQEPEVLLVDEPTNHLDVDARALVLDALTAFRGTGLLVSHDRELLNRLCRQCLFLDPPHAVLRAGNYTEASDDARREDASRRADRRTALHDLARLKDSAQRRHAEAAGADRKRSARYLARGDHDGRERIGRARVSGKDGQAGRLARQLDGRLAQAQSRLESLTVKKQYEVNFWLEGSVSPRPRLAALPATTLALDGRRRLEVPALALGRQDRIALTGANGLGKSTLIRHLLTHLDLPSEHLIYLPQEIALDDTRATMAEVHQLSHDQLGTAMTVVSALGSRPERLLHNLKASPGELRKILLALGIVRHPHLIVMDEPTNHLDLPAIEALEAALINCPCAVLLASHDLRFLANVTTTRWHLHQDGDTVTLTTTASFDEPTTTA